MDKTKFALIDCNNFYVSCERLFNPQLRNKPVVVLSGNDGCIVARSQEAKKIGIKMGEPLFKCKHLIDQHNIVTISGNLTLYTDISRRVMNTLREITDKVYIYSIDEAFLDIQDIDEDPIRLARRIRKLVYKKVGVPVSIGVASTKTLCKLATNVAKSDMQNSKGVASFINKNISSLLDKTSIQEIWGIGKRTSARLISSRILTAGQFVLQDTKYLQKILGSKLPLQTYHELKGISCIPFRERTMPQSILCSRSLNKEISDLATVQNLIASFVMQAYKRLHKSNGVARTLSIIMNENRFKVEDYKHNLSVNFPTSHADFQLFLQEAKRLVQENHDPKKYYKQIGIALSQIQNRNDVPHLLFEETNDDKSSRLFEVMDFLNTKYNKPMLQPLSTKLTQEYSKREYFSQRYTTEWDELLEINI